MDSVLSEITDLREQVVEALTNLDEQERLVLALYYYEDLTLAEIAEVMELTEAQVAIVRVEAVEKVKTKLPNFTHSGA